ncbi:hypothetical protein [Kushneria indalinina]|uniref:Uncharacterized protein n=1 Tax=Kushneria indalinina DSM 14324 TaxID=1122140 RepID=A0A3D9DRQ1_9GAMM|nr:hypothetical protein [Kushneria indalinina]REC93382.1 hypothetical protein C8D72_3427 [Kushneria indalinina DSM 14324]
MTSTFTTAVGLLAHRDMGLQLPLCALKSAAGYYIGTVHDEHGPVSRESVEYFGTQQQAEEALASGRWTQRLSSGL